MSDRAAGGGGHAGVAGDAYDRRLRSAGYRAERARKARVILRLCAEELAAADRVADLGSGTGIIKKTLEEETGKYIYGFELDRSFMEHPRGTAVADVTRLPVADGALDFLLLNHLYEHVEAQGALFREAFRTLRPGGAAYVAAGNRLAVVEPHYRPPFLSWLPRPVADRYLRWTGRGRRYEGIRFRTRGPLLRMMREAGFRVRDRTERAMALVDASRGRPWRIAAGLLRALPGVLRRPLLHAASPQWFFLLEKPAGRPGPRTVPAERGRAGIASAERGAAEP